MTNASLLNSPDYLGILDAANLNGAQALLVGFNTDGSQTIAAKHWTIGQKLDYDENVAIDSAAIAGRNAVHLQVLSQYADQGNREGYWNYLAAQGVPYAQLALGVVRNDSLNGYVANTYAATRAEELGVKLSERDWNDLGVDLMRRDFAYRQTYTAMPDAQDKVLYLPVNDIADYHKQTFESFGLDAKAWTAYVPLSPYLRSGDYTKAEDVWSTMMDTNRARQIGGSVWANASGAGPDDWPDHAIWQAKVAAITTSYFADPNQSFSNADKIGPWNHDDNGWYRFDTSSPEYRVGSPREYLPQSASADLDAARAFRLERLLPHPRNPLDFSPAIGSR
jgi:hypothetical protein